MTTTTGGTIVEGDVVYPYVHALREILNTLGPASCRCAGEQAEVDEAIRIATIALGGPDTLVEIVP